jgi:hypothetical protein
MPRRVALAFAAVLSLAATQTVARASATDDTAWVIVVDDLHTPFVQTGRMRDLLRKVAAELIQEGDRYQFRASGPSAASLKTDALTDDRSLASSAIKMMTGNALKDRDILAVRSSAAAVNEVLYRANTALDAAEEAVFALTREAAPHQAIVYVSSGYDVGAFPALSERVRRLATRARENNITIFVIDARGFNLADLDPSIDTSTTATRRSLNMMAEETGGFVIDRLIEPGTELKRINAQMRK